MVGKGFTNCADKNGKYIYVGDLVKYKNKLYCIVTHRNSFYLKSILDDEELLLPPIEKEVEVKRAAISLD